MTTNVVVTEVPTNVAVDDIENNITIPASTPNSVNVTESVIHVTPGLIENFVTVTDDGDEIHVTVIPDETLVTAPEVVNHITITQPNQIITVTADRTTNNIQSTVSIVEVITSATSGVALVDLDELSSVYGFDLANAVSNSRFALNENGWTISGAHARLDHVELEVPSGSAYQYVMRFGGQYARYTGRRLPVIYGEHIFADVYCATPVAAPNIQLKVFFYDMLGSKLGEVTIASRSANVLWSRIGGEAINTFVGAINAEFVLEIASADATYNAAKRWYFTSARMVTASSGELANARITTEETTRASADTVLASSITTLSTEVDDLSATVSTFASSIDGIQAEWGVKVTVNGPGNNVVTGMVKLDGTVDNSTFKVWVDNFIVTNEDGDEGTAPFQIIGGQTFIEEAVIPDITATIITIKDNGVIKVLDDQVTPITRIELGYLFDDDDYGLIIRKPNGDIAWLIDSLGDDMVFNNNINAGAVTGGASGSIATTTILDVNIAANTITGGKIAGTTIAASNIVNSTITATQIANSTITATQIANSTITGGNIAGTTITAANIVSGTITGTQISSATITGGNIAGTTITASNIQNATITGTQIASTTIAASNIVNSTITGGKIAGTTITAANIVAGTITGTEISSATITDSNIVNSTITGAKIAANTITAANIVAGTITATEIAADSITVDKLTIGNFGSNLILNPDAETDLSAWRVVHRATATSLLVTRDTSNENSGVAAFKIADNSTHGTMFGSKAIAVKPGEKLAWSVWIKGSGASAAGLYIRMQELTSKPTTLYVGSTSNSLTGIDNATSTTDLITASSAIPNVYTYYENTYTVPAGVKYVSFSIGNWTASTVDLYFDDVRVRRLLSAITIEDGTITGAKIAAVTIDASNIVNSTITGGKIAGTTITASNITAATITNAQIANATILDANITASTITGGKIAGTTITAANITASTITATQIANSTITGGKIANTTITAANIFGGTITGTEIASATITGGNIAGTTITAANITNSTITGAKIANATITGANIQANTITAANIAVGTLTATEITVGTLVASRLSIGDVSNLILDDEFKDTDYWAFGSGWAFSTNIADAPGLLAASMLKTPTGNGTTSQTTTSTASTAFIPVEPGAPYAVYLNSYIKSGFTGRIRMYVDGYAEDKTTLIGAGAVHTIDRRTSAAPSDLLNTNGFTSGNSKYTTLILSGTVAYIKVRFEVTWSTTLNNAAYAYFARPKIYRVMDESQFLTRSIPVSKLKNLYYDNLIIDPFFSSVGTVSDTWQMLTGGTYDTSTDVTNILRLPAAIKTPAGNGTTFQSNPVNSLSTVFGSGDVLVENGKTYRVSARVLVKAGFTGRIYIDYKFFKHDSTSAPGANGIIYGMDYRSVAAVSDTVEIIEGFAVASVANSLRLTFALNMEWSSTLNNAQYAYFGQPSVMRAVEAYLIAPNTITNASIASGTITSAEIANLTIVANDIANSTITGGKIAGTTITAANITAGTITATEVANTTLTGGKLVNNTITATQIQASTITNTEIANTTITGGKLVNGTITATQIADGTITNIKVAANTLQASKFAQFDGDNGIFDPLFNDTAYWTFATGWAQDVSADSTTTLNIPSGIKTPTGNGTTSQTTTRTTPPAANYTMVEGGKEYRVCCSGFVKSGYTGLQRVIIFWFKQDKTTAASTASVTFNMADYRTSAAGADTPLPYLDESTQAPADAVWARYALDASWSTTLNNAQYAIFGVPRLERLSDSVRLKVTATANTSVVVPANYAIRSIFITNTTTNAVTGGLRIGTGSGGSQVLAAFTVGATANDPLSPTDAQILKRIFSISASQQLFIQAITNWNSASLNIVILLDRVY